MKPLLPLVFLFATAPVLRAGERDFEEKIRPLVGRHCQPCHGPEKKKGGLDLLRFESTEQVLGDYDAWKKAVGRINVHEMPPKGQRQLKQEDMALIDRWFNALPRPKRDCDELANDANQRW